MSLPILADEIVAITRSVLRVDDAHVTVSRVARGERARAYGRTDGFRVVVRRGSFAREVILTDELLRRAPDARVAHEVRGVAAELRAFMLTTAS